MDNGSALPTGAGNVTPTGNSASAPPLNPKLRKRTKTGCLTCRKRRIKCGEEKPICNNCIKFKRHCEGYNQRVIFKAPIGDRLNHPSTVNTLPNHNSLLLGARPVYHRHPQPIQQQQQYLQQGGQFQQIPVSYDSQIIDEKSVISDASYAAVSQAYLHPPFPSAPSSLLPPSILPGPKWDKFVSVKKWQEKTSPNIEPGEVGILGRLYKSGLDIFSSLIRTSRKRPELSKDKQEAVEHQFQLFRLWGDDFDAPRGGLDKHLLYSRDLQQTTLSLLISTSEVLSQRLIRYMLPSADARRSVWETTDIATLLEEARCSNSENTEFDDEANRSDESETDFPTDSIDEVLEDLKVGIRCLIDLIPSILWPAVDPEHREKVPLISFLKERPAHQYYSDLLSKRFPEADPNLIERLGQANWTRYKRCRAEIEVNVEKETIDIDPSGSVYSPSKFHDSGLGSSVPARTTYAQSIVSSDGSRSRIPPLSEIAKKGEPFPCDACGRSIRVKGDREWRKHLYHDLQPYTCFYQGCHLGDVAFKSREVWAEHLVLDHALISDSKDVQCPLCLKVPMRDSSTISRHLAGHMEEVSLGALSRGADSEASSETSSVHSNEILSPDTFPNLSQGQNQFALEPPTTTPTSLPNPTTLPSTSTVFQAAPQPATAPAADLASGSTTPAAAEQFITTTLLSQYDTSYVEDQATLSDSTSVKSEKRSQSMTIWWAERKARAAEKKIAEMKASGHPIKDSGAIGSPSSATFATGSPITPAYSSAPGTMGTGSGLPALSSGGTRNPMPLFAPTPTPAYTHQRAPPVYCSAYPLPDPRTSIPKNPYSASPLALAGERQGSQGAEKGEQEREREPAQIEEI